MRGRPEQLEGQRFGRWTVIERYGTKDHRAVWKCQCDCGNIGYVTTTDLKGGKSKSCGCLLKDVMHSLATHGDSKPWGEYNRLYKIWADMKNRCSDINCHAYDRYGGIGIKVCDEWKDYPTFKEWSLNNGYDNKLTIDRIDPFGDYTPDNCRWADYKTQGNNKRNTKKYLHNGEEHSLTEWSRITGIDFHILSKRIHDYHWNIDDALTIPPNSIRKYKSDVSSTKSCGQNDAETTTYSGNSTSDIQNATMDVPMTEEVSE